MGWGSWGPCTWETCAGAQLPESRQLSLRTPRQNPESNLCKIQPASEVLTRRRVTPQFPLQPRPLCPAAFLSTPLSPRCPNTPIEVLRPGPSPGALRPFRCTYHKSGAPLTTPSDPADPSPRQCPPDLTVQPPLSWQDSAVAF